MPPYEWRALAATASRIRWACSSGVSECAKNTLLLSRATTIGCLQRINALVRGASLGQPPKCAVVASKVFRTLPPSIRAAIEANGPVKTVRSVINVPESVGSMR